MALSVDAMALLVETIELSVDTMALLVDTIELSANTMALLVNTIELSVDAIALRPIEVSNINLLCKMQALTKGYGA
ncbi:hypothetical protein NIES4072_33480 [Nostoc commune NIES-4072]|uniref:Uncharacterized protein n=1 Tax=Nostoc commune NIES-4072 TaxID=2005467 RepID=A0A2R5FNR0_NOSCO|nr:hypothetical protein [Nostoc commune]BBD69326.1 hypothetical protein NIES4070_57340 [Nostoc commune HK-02]GBG19679.1 hypothetical protein NIES4072_33480 [Nostoc commune NIES-4072]